MTTRVPDWWAFVLLAGAIYRLFRLAAFDVITEPARTWLLGPEGTDGERRKRPKLGHYVLCPWCFGFAITAVWWLAWLAWPHATLFLSAPLAINLAVGLCATRLDP